MGVYILFTMEQVAEQAQEFVNTQLNEMKNTVENWESLPWSPVTPPEVVAEKMPSFVIAEILFAVVSLVCFVHSYKKGRTYILVWWASILAGVANDAIFMFLPGVDNFFHAQGTVMLTPRLPLYILFVYNSFIYVSVVAGFQLQLGVLGNSAFVGLLAEAFYCVYDLIGVKFLWWTWHDTDVAIFERIQDVPVGSSMWVITFTSSFYFLLHILSCRSRRIGWPLFFFIILMLCLFTTPMMMAQMVLFQLGGVMGRPNVLSFSLLLLGYMIVISASMIYSDKWLSKRFKPSFVDGVLSTAINIYFAALTFMAVVFKAEDQVSEGYHQSLGQCGVPEENLSGLTREKFLCAQQFQEPFVISDVGSGEKWYTIAGVENQFIELWVIGICFVGLIGITFYSYLYTASPLQTPAPTLKANRTPSMNPMGKNKIDTSNIPSAEEGKRGVRKRKK